MSSRKSDVQVTLDSTSIAVLKTILHQVEQAKAKRDRQLQRQNSMVKGRGQLALLSEVSDTTREDNRT
jgi:hypothetical protein